ncbi:MAG: hypothetical protein GQ474_05915 [Sulfurimonas sp.]|nr:hypothetical protein [Sulfurimonas sp.]
MSNTLNKELLKALKIKTNTPLYQRVWRLSKFEWFKELLKLAELGLKVKEVAESQSKEKKDR